MSDTWLIVGLGNPGPNYAKTRHNIGQMVLDELAKEVGGSFKKHSKASRGCGGGAPGLRRPQGHPHEVPRLHEHFGRPRQCHRQVLRH